MDGLGLKVGCEWYHPTTFILLLLISSQANVWDTDRQKKKEEPVSVMIYMYLVIKKMFATKWLYK